MIRKATGADAQDILRIYGAARAYMIANGNRSQWLGGYPERLLDEDIRKGQLYVVCGEDGTAHGCFVFFVGEEPNYRIIERGAWESDAPYGTIHRMGSDGTVKGVFAQALAFCAGQIAHIRADTHEDNVTMQRALEKHGFARRGTIYVEDGTPRIAYEYQR